MPLPLFIARGVAFYIYFLYLLFIFTFYIYFLYLLFIYKRAEKPEATPFYIEKGREKKRKAFFFKHLFIFKRG